MYLDTWRVLFKAPAGAGAAFMAFVTKVGAQDVQRVARPGHCCGWRSRQRQRMPIRGASSLKPVTISPSANKSWQG
jgi:hypothetical protein